jgi:hypothetical protein
MPQNKQMPTLNFTTKVECNQGEKDWVPATFWEMSQNIFGRTKTNRTKENSRRHQV